MSKKPEVPPQKMTIEEAYSGITEAKWNDPIYRRGFQVVVKKHTPIPQALVESEAVRLGFRILPPDHAIYKEPPSIMMVSRPPSKKK